MAQRPSLVGQQFGNYQLLRLLGAGGFAEVYLGEHLHLGRQDAIKVLQTQLTLNNINALRAEARTIANLKHPHIIHIFDFNVQGSTPFLVMDYAAGGTMRDRYPKGTIVSLSAIVSSIQQVADALQYAHDEKLIHRDIKPENILLDQHDHVLLSDFGIALIAQSSRNQSTQDLIGTAAYMAPEQIQGKPRPASDQYSLGIVVYEWLCGTPPFQGSLTELCTQHITTPPPPLHEKATYPEVERVIMTALAKDPDQRFDSVRTFATALQEACQGEQRQIIISSHSPTSITIPVSQPELSQTITHPHSQTRPCTKWRPIGNQKWAFCTSGPVASSPTMANGTVYFGSHDQHFYALNAASGQLLWSFPTNGKVLSSPTVANSVVYFGSHDQHFYALNAASGQLLWSFPTNGKVLSSPTVANDVVYFGSHDRNLYALDATSGQPIWEFTTDGPVTSSPTVVNGIVYFGSHDRNLYARDATSGQHMWSFSTSGKVFSSPIVVNDVVYCGSHDKKLYALDAVSGRLKWSFSTNGKVSSSPTVVNGIVYFSSRDSHLYALDVASGKLKWSFPTSNWIEQILLPAVSTSSPTVEKGCIYFGSDNHKLYALDASSRKQEWCFATRGTVQSSPTVANGVAYVGSHDGNLYAIFA